MTQLSRRESLQHTAAGAAVAGTASLVSGGLAQAEPARLKLPMREFGKTGVRVSILALGGGGTGRNPQIRGTQQRPRERELAEKIIGRAFEAGVNYLDSCTGYGTSEEILGDVLKPHRRDVFLVTKCDWLYFSARQPERRRADGIIRAKYTEICRSRLKD